MVIGRSTMTTNIFLYLTAIFFATCLCSIKDEKVVVRAAFVPPNDQCRRHVSAATLNNNSFNVISTGRTFVLHQSSNNNNSNNNSIKGRIDKGFNLLEIASSIVPQGRIVQTAKQSWKFLWLRFMTELAPQDSDGNYRRPSYTFSSATSQHQSTLGSIQHPIEGKRRYTVYLGNPCPWCHRVKLVVNLLGLETHGLVEVVSLVDDPVRASRGGWVMPTSSSSSSTSSAALSKNTPNNIKDLRELYDYLRPGFTGRCTAPLLVDWQSRSIVSNESKDIVRMLPLLLDCLPTSDTQSKNNKDEKMKSNKKYKIELYPSHLQSTIEEQNEWIYELLNNGVYRCGFGTTQQAIDAASQDVLEGLRRCEDVLSRQSFMCSDDTMTESDVMLLPTMLRFDGVYAPLFRAGGTHLRLECDYPSVFAWLQRCWNEVPGVSESIDLTDACHSYYKQLFPLNPSGILPTPITPQLLRLEK